MELKINFLIIFCLCTQLTIGQEDSLICEVRADQGISYIKKAQKYYKKAQKALKKKNTEDYKAYLDLALEIDSDFIKTHYLLGQLYIKKDNKEKSKYHFEKVIDFCPEYKEHIYFDLAEIAFSEAKTKGNEGQYKRCVECLDEYMKRIEEKHYNFKKAFERYLLCSEFNDIYNYPVPYNPIPLKGISSSADEYLPILSPDNEIMLFTMRFKEEPKGKSAYKKIRFVEKFYQAKKADSSFVEIRALPKPFNQGKNTGGATMDISNSEIIVTICNDPDNEGGGNCDLYYTKRNGSEWSKFKNLNELSTSRVNTKFWEAQPSLSSDGQTLYFTSDRQSLGKGGADIFFTTKDSNGLWQRPKIMGPNINTVFEEQSPFIHPDNRTLYFSSEGHTSLGGKDIFYVRKLKNGKWSKAFNIGQPINDENDNSDFFVSTDGKTAYFSKESKIRGQGWDVFYFPLHNRAKPKKVVLLKGKLNDANGNAIEDGSIELQNGVNNTSHSAKLGEGGSYAFIQTIEEDDEKALDNYADVSLIDTSKVPDFDFEMKIQKEGYFYGSEKISSSDTNKLTEVNFNLKKIEKGASFRMKNLLFDTDSFRLKEASFSELELLYEFLCLNQSVKISIEGHTDNKGSWTKNKKLSQNRAEAVLNYLVERGINKERLKHEGFGPAKPIASNNTEKGRQLNRRTEIKIL